MAYWAIKDIKTILLAVVCVGLTISVIIFPEAAFNASVSGLRVWWNIVFPALLPFFIIAQLLIGLGVVHMLGVLLEPVMRPVFNVPGSGSFVMAMGLASGFPIGAVLTTQLRKQNLCNKTEAERLLSFTNTADPLFMFGAVSVGMIGYPEAGIIIASAHYLSSLSVGLIMRFYKNKEHPSSQPSNINKQNLFARSLSSLIEARQKDSRPLGQLMGDAVIKSVETLMLIGGLIILFSVIISILEEISLAGFMAREAGHFLSLSGLSTNLSPAIISGIFEIDLGCQAAGGSQAPLRDIIIISSVIIAWSGLAVHAQVASIISETDINIIPYIIARLIHGTLAGIYSFLLAGPVFPLIETVAIPAIYNLKPTGDIIFWWARTTIMFQYLILILLSLGLLSIIAYFFSKIKLKITLPKTMD